MFSLTRNITKCCGSILYQHLPFIKERATVSTLITADVLLSEGNRHRAMDLLQRAPPIGVRLEKHRSEKNYAAVLILLCTSAANPNDVSLLFTRRSGRLSRHKREISFPGGLKDPTDLNFIDCALRETEEEVGLSRKRVEIWGIGSIVSPPRTAEITPVVGVVENFELDELQVNEHEVEEAFTVPVSKLVDHNTLRHTQFKSGYSAPAFVVEQYKIWGVTGLITNRFLKCLIPREMRRLHRHGTYIKPYRHHHHH